MTRRSPKSERKNTKRILDENNPFHGDYEDTAVDLHETFVRAQAGAMRDLIQQVGGQKNRGFKQVYSRYWERIRTLAARQNSVVPLMLYMTLCEFSGPTSADVASNDVLGKILGRSAKTVQRASKVLVEIGAVRRFQIAEGGAYCYALNPDEIWGGFAADKAIAPFHTLKLVSYKEQDEATKATIPTIAPPRVRSAAKSQGDANAIAPDAASDALGIEAADVARIAATVLGLKLEQAMGMPLVPPGAQLL